ncbi:hypothetical protein C6P45_003690 [Maudiozyma exigua]|uniref:polynucleotide adenylyltransferase n=1 Tax=Maudiozyma exigua TaxID=34358 RepID=A0A9P7BCE8_MAUEX|nr:hypothetical protein C6P45_003690 [Kazachstania exigua]
MRKKNSKKIGKKPFKKMRKSSFNKVQKKFDIFHQEIDNFNNYESLTLDISEPEVIISSDDEIANEPIFQVDLDKTKHRDIPEVNYKSEDNDLDVISDDKDVNKIELNNDFIAFSESESENNDDTNNIQSADEDAQVVSMSKVNPTKNLNERTKNDEFPWLLNRDHSTQTDMAKWLTLEINDFISYISPSKDEIESRNHTIKKLRMTVRRLWPDATLHVFGSYATDLYLPGSDIDCVVTSKAANKDHRSYLYELARYLKSKSIGTQIEVIAKARVPIIKFVDISSGLHIDVSFERLNGIEIAKVIRNWIDDTPGLRELVLVIKQFLKSRRLNEVHTGGLGGLSVVCLVYSFLYLHPRLRTEDIEPCDNLGVLLIDFFELYGKNFSYENVALSFQDDTPKYMRKSHWRALPPSRNSMTLAIQDPLDISNNISRSSYNVSGIKKAFSGAFNMISNKCYELNQATFKDRIGKSILGNIIKYKGEARHFKDERELVENRAIVENERYHLKRTHSTIDLIEEEGEKDDMFLSPSDDDVLTGGQNELDMYRISQPPKKRRKLKDIRKPEVQPVIKHNKSNKKRKVPEGITKLIPKSGHSKKIDELMGIDTVDNEDDGDNSNDINNDSDTFRLKNARDKEDTDESARSKSNDKKKVDSQTRRDYWLSKGQTLASVTIPNKHT